MAVSDRGFASMDRKKHAEIARLGGKAAHAQGVAHTWTPNEAMLAGRKGGLASAASKAAKKALRAVNA